MHFSTVNVCLVVFNTLRCRTRCVHVCQLDKKETLAAKLMWVVVVQSLWLFVFYSRLLFGTDTDITALCKYSYKSGLTGYVKKKAFMYVGRYYSVLHLVFINITKLNNRKTNFFLLVSVFFCCTCCNIHSYHQPYYRTSGSLTIALHPIQASVPKMYII